MKLFSKLITLFVLLALGACSTSKFIVTDVDRWTYVQDEMKNYKLHFTDKTFYFEDDFDYSHLSLFNCEDTLAFGYWEKGADNLIKLYTEPLRYASLIEIKVNESIRADDSLYFEISNPIERSHRKNNKTNPLFYKMFVEMQDGTLNREISLKKYNTNRFAVYLEQGQKISSIELLVFPAEPLMGWRSDSSPKAFTSLPYTIINHNSNVFKISIPDLTYCYLSSLQLNGDFIRIINSKQLEWDGHIYTRE